MVARAAIAIALSVIALTSSAVAAVRPGAPAPVDPARVTAELVTDETAVPAGRASRPIPSSTPIPLVLTLDFANETRLTGLLANLTNPRSAEYRGFLSAAEFRARYAPTRAEIRTARGALLSAGAASVAVSPGDLAVAAVLPASGVEQLLGIRLVEYATRSGTWAYTALGAPVLPVALAGTVAGVGGLSDADNREVELAAEESRPAPVDQFVLQKSRDVQWDVGTDFASAFGATSLWPGPGSVANATYPTGIAIATLLASAYNSSFAENLPPFDPAVVGAYFNATLGPGWPDPTVTGVPVPVPGASTPPAPGSFGAIRDSTEDEYENSLDVEMAGSVAPGASVFNFYFAGSQMASPSLSVGDLADDFGFDLDAALNYSYGASVHLAVVSASFGLPEVSDALWSSGLEEATALGVTVVAASGDQGDAPPALTGREGQWPFWPATDATDVTGAISVGGATVTLEGRQTSNATVATIDPAFDPYVTGLASASAWYENTSSGQLAGSEGGASELYAEPSWQFDSAAQPPIVNATILQGSGFLGRAGPDVAYPANNTITYVFANATGTIYLDVLGGTSVAAPTLAAVLADVVAVESVRADRFSPLGFLDPELYRIASYYASTSVRGTPGEANDPFLGIDRGRNYVFSAASGWNAVTGWGEISAPAFLAADLNSTVADYVYSGPTPGLPTSKGPLLSAQNEYLLIAIGALVAIALVIVAARPARRPPVVPVSRGSGPNADPFGTTARAPAEGGPTFACPYCGLDRPAEPVRCPHCGNL